MSELDFSRRRHELFGVPTVLTALEAKQLLRQLAKLWSLTYGSAPSAISADFRLCKRYFDPIARGQTLRDRLSTLPDTSPEVARTLSPYGPPLVIEARSGVLLVGPEGRILIELLESKEPNRDHVVLSPDEVAAAEHHALRLYREWGMVRLMQVIDLQTGRGSEVMQALAVGVAIALLVNRSDAPERAIVQEDASESQRSDGDSAVYAGAERFADIIAKTRSGRSVGEQKLRGGYGITEARRRLGGQRLVISHQAAGRTLIYIPREYRQEVVQYLGRDLARRVSLDSQTLEAAYDGLVESFRKTSGVLSRRAMAFDRPADTQKLRRDLLGEFNAARAKRREGVPTHDGNTDGLARTALPK